MILNINKLNFLQELKYYFHLITSQHKNQGNSFQDSLDLLPFYAGLEAKPIYQICQIIYSFTQYFMSLFSSLLPLQHYLHSYHHCQILLHPQLHLRTSFTKQLQKMKKSLKKQITKIKKTLVPFMRLKRLLTTRKGNIKFVGQGMMPYTIHGFQQKISKNLPQKRFKHILILRKIKQES